MSSFVMAQRRPHTLSTLTPTPITAEKTSERHTPLPETTSSVSDRAAPAPNDRFAASPARALIPLFPSDARVSAVLIPHGKQSSAPSTEEREASDAPREAVPEIARGVIQARMSVKAVGTGKPPSASGWPPMQRKNVTGLPDRLKEDVEALSGVALDDVRVQYNSPKAAAIGALAYARGAEIHLGAGQERHLTHEAWHVVQQKQGRVKPTLMAKGLPINADAGLEREADAVAAQLASSDGAARDRSASVSAGISASGDVIQRKTPDTEVKWTYENKEDKLNNLKFTYPVLMEGLVSTAPGNLQGSGPDGKAAWWPYFQARHKVMSGGKGDKLYWVQGHLLNDNIHGPGTPENLVPISNTTNTNMESGGEKTAKHLVLNQGQVIWYKVGAIWNQTPDVTMKNWGPYDPNTGKGLLPGECTAPTALAWEVWTMKETSPDVWVKDAQVFPPQIGWYNTFPEGN